MLSSIDFAQGAAHQLGEIGNERADIGRFGVERLPAAEREQLGGQLGALLQRVLRLPQHLALIRVAEAPLNHLQVAGDHGQKIIEIVSDAAGQLADRLHLLRLPELRLHLVAGRQIADEPGKDSLAAGLRFANGQFHWKDFAAFGQALDHPAVTDDAGVPGFQISADVFVMFVTIRSGHQHLDVAADDLFGIVAEQLRRRRAERGDDPALVDDDHRLRNRIEDRAQMRLAGHKVGLGLLQRGDVAVDLKDRRNFLVGSQPRDPEARDRDEGAVFLPLLDLALPAAVGAKLLDDLLARQRIAGLQKLMENLSQRFFAAPAVKALASARPEEDLALLVMDDDVRQV